MQATYKVQPKAGPSGRWLLTSSFLVSCAITAVASADIAISSLAPIILYMTAAAGIDASPYLVAQVTAAHIWSGLLSVSAFPNMVVAEAYGIRFFTYLRWSLLPCIGEAHSTLQVHNCHVQNKNHHIQAALL